MTNAEAKTYRDEIRSNLYRLLDEEFERGEITVLQCRIQEAKIDEEYPV